MPKDRYASVQIALHWSVVALVAAQFLLSSGVESAFDARLEGSGERSALASLHIFLGAATFIAVAIRLFIRRDLGVPAPSSPTPALAKAALATHWAFYAVLLAMPVAGALAWFQMNETAATLHGLASKALLALIALHAGAALYHHFVQKTGTLDRMRP